MVGRPSPTKGLRCSKPLSGWSGFQIGTRHGSPIGTSCNHKDPPRRSRRWSLQPSRTSDKTTSACRATLFYLPCLQNTPRRSGRTPEGKFVLVVERVPARRTDTPTRHTRKAGDRLKAGWAGTLARLIERHFRAWEGGKAGFGCGPLQDIASGHGEPAPVSFGRRTRSGSLRASRGLCSGRYKMGAKRREEAAGRGSEVRSGWAIPQRSSRS